MVSSSGRDWPAGEQEPGRAVHGVRVARPRLLPPRPRGHCQHPGSHGQGPPQAPGTANTSLPDFDPRYVAIIVWSYIDRIADPDTDQACEVNMDPDQGSLWPNIEQFFRVKKFTTFKSIIFKIFCLSGLHYGPSCTRIIVEPSSMILQVLKIQKSLDI